MNQTSMPTVILGDDMPPELAADVSNALQQMGVIVRANGTSARPRGSKLIVVISPKGGSGKTAIASNLAVALAERHPGRVVVVDLDVQFGDLESALALSAERTLAPLVNGSQVDATTLKLFLTPYASSLYVLAGAHDPVAAESITPAHVAAVLPMLAEEFEYVIVDTPAGLDDRTLAAVECANELLLVSSLDVSSIRNLRKATDALDKIGITTPRQFVLNRADAKVGLTAADAEEAVGMPILCSIPSSRDLPLSMNVGTPVVLGNRRSPVARHLLQLAEHYAPAATAKARRSWRR